MLSSIVVVVVSERLHGVKISFPGVSGNEGIARKSSKEGVPNGTVGTMNKKQMAPSVSHVQAAAVMSSVGAPLACLRSSYGGRLTMPPVTGS